MFDFKLSASFFFKRFGYLIDNEVLYLVVCQQDKRSNQQTQGRGVCNILLREDNTQRIGRKNSPTGKGIKSNYHERTLRGQPHNDYKQKSG